jgi:hypothetical protein
MIEPPGLERGRAFVFFATGNVTTAAAPATPNGTDERRAA